MRTNKTVHIPKEKILVFTGDQALATGALNTTGNAVNLQDGQGGVLSNDVHSATTAVNNFITAGNTSTQVKEIKVVQGTPNSQNLNLVNAFQVGHKAYQESGVINPKKVLTVSTALPEIGVFDMEYRSGFAAPVIGQDYTFGVTLESHKRDLEFTRNKRDRFNVATHAVPVAPVSATDEILQNWASDLNVGSVWTKGFDPFIVFGINAGGAGTVINTIDATTSIPFITLDGVTYNFQSSMEFVNSLTKAIANEPALATAGIQVIDKTTAGAAANVDGLLVVGLNEAKAVVFDDWDVEKVRVFTDTGLDSTRTEVAHAAEQSGSGSQWYKRWTERAAFDGTTYNTIGHPYQLQLSNIPSYIDSTKLYTATIVEHEGNEETITVDPTYSHNLVILIEATVTNPAATAGTAYTIATSDTTTVASLNASLGAWLSTASDNFSNVDYIGAATQAAPFV